MARFRATSVDHASERVAEAIHSVQRRAYEQEARLLGVHDFPPLSRTIEDIRTSREAFLAVHVDARMVGAASVEPDPECEGTLITSLTVEPDFQRRGIASALLAEILRRHGTQAVTVQTGALNAPALRLYERLGFVPIRRWTVGRESLVIVKLRREPQDAETRSC